MFNNKAFSNLFEIPNKLYSLSNVVFGTHNENEGDIFRPETTDIFIDNDDENASNASLSSFVNNIECMDPHAGEVTKIPLAL